MADDTPRTQQRRRSRAASAADAAVVGTPAAHPNDRRGKAPTIEAPAVEAAILPTVPPSRGGPVEIRPFEEM